VPPAEAGGFFFANDSDGTAYRDPWCWHPRCAAGSGRNDGRRSRVV